MSTMFNQENDAPLESFAGCHIGIVNMVRDLAELPDLITPVRRFQSITLRIDDFFNQVVKTHHSEEEEQLFTAVLASANSGDEKAEVEQLISKLTDEHREIERAFVYLIPQIKALEKNVVPEFNAKNVDSLVELYLAHARFEEEVFLPLAKTILGRNDNHMAAFGLSLHMRHAVDDIRREFGII
ncbi:hemerythrin domain-containing protein [Rhodoferax ferrireducens]|uniref:hemerythrin domain-containing protein n=1 Tax=Rhodoferax ferrireducens TaxID=192843 RepID=UPI000E0DF2E6|nr:hemerythrin domain-containing protein [Rhodoferax ferrireducens]